MVTYKTAAIDWEVEGYTNNPKNHKPIRIINLIETLQN
jgi:hypothetical protein